jgi:hypothetical protein
MLTLDGRGIWDINNYSVNLRLETEGTGYLNFGYEEFRTFYDGSGGFFPVTGQWFELYDDALSLDRGRAWFEGGLRIPDAPAMTFRYTYMFRDGSKDSTSWGDSGLVGLGTQTRGIVPSFWDIDEDRHIFEGDVAHAVGNTGLGLGVRYELSDINNARQMRRRPDEASDRHLTQRERVDTDLFNAHASTETRFNEKVMFTTGYSFTTLDTDIGGTRIYGAGYDAMYDPLFARRQARDEGFFGLHGGSQMKQYVANVNLLLRPVETVHVVPSVRVEKRDIDSRSAFFESIVQPGTLVTEEEDLEAESDRGLIDISERLEARYTGVENWVFYARGDWTQGQGDLREIERDVATTAVVLERDTDDERFTQKYTAGANWYPRAGLNFGAQYYHKIRNNEYDHKVDSTDNTTGDRYPAWFTHQDFTTDDVNFRATWRPLNNLTLVGRYDFQLSTVDTRGDGLALVESSEITSHILSGSASWTPVSRLYLQASVSYAMDETETPVPGITPVVTDAENNYWNGTFSAGFALDEKTDLQGSYFYYRSDNYQDNSAFSVPFGSEAEEHGMTVALIRRIRENLQWTVKYGFFTLDDRTSGGHSDYDAHLLYTSVRCLF